MEFRSYILAAGHGTRAGGPKAWLEHDGKTLLQRHLDLHPNAVVSIQPDWVDRCRAISLSATFVPVNPDLPAFASLHAMLRFVAPKGPAFVLHVDQPVWDRGLFDALAAAFPPGTPAAVPTYKGRRGHPALLSREILEAALALDPLKGRLDVLLRERGAVEVPLPYEAAVADWNLGAPR